MKTDTDYEQEHPSFPRLHTPPGLTVESDPADLLADLAVLPHEEGVGGAAAIQQTALVPGLQ